MPTAPNSGEAIINDGQDSYVYPSILDALKDDMDRIADTINSDTANPMLSNLDRIANKLNTTSTDPMMSNLDKIAEGIESGGGGGELNNPVLTINVDATGVSGEVGTLPLFSINNGVLQITDGVVNGGSSHSYETLLIEFVYDDESYFGWNGVYYSTTDVTSSTHTLSTSNAVNCEIYLDQTIKFFSVIVEDPTQPASFTLTVS